MKLSRRQMAAFASLLFIAGCSPASMTVTDLAKYAQAAANAAADVLASLSALVTVPPAVAGYIADIQKAAAAILAKPSAAGASLGQQLYDAVKALLPIVAPFLDAVPGVGIALGALQALLPWIAIAAGLQGAAPPTRSAAMAKIPVLTKEQALAIYGAKR